MHLPLVNCHNAPSCMCARPLVVMSCMCVSCTYDARETNRQSFMALSGENVSHTLLHNTGQAFFDLTLCSRKGQECGQNRACHNARRFQQGIQRIPFMVVSDSEEACLDSWSDTMSAFGIPVSVHSSTLRHGLHGFFIGLINSRALLLALLLSLLLPLRL